VETAGSSQRSEANAPGERPAFRELRRRWLSPSLFALAALAFLLPFATVSCDNAKTTFTGIQLVTRSVPRGGRVNEAGSCTGDLSGCVERRSSDTARAALAATVIGLLLGLFRLQRGPGWCAAAGFAAMLTLPFESGDADVRYHAGYWLILFFIAWAGGLHFKRAVRRWLDRRAALGKRPPRWTGAPP